MINGDPLICNSRNLVRFSSALIQSNISQSVALFRPISDVNVGPNISGYCSLARLRRPGSERFNPCPAEARQKWLAGLERTGKPGTMGWTVRPRRADEEGAVLAVVREAFKGPERDGEVEAGIVARTWAVKASPAGLDLVAVDGAAIVGHVLGAVGQLGGKPALAVAPLCVAPSRQGEGIGSALMNDLLHRAATAGWPLVLLLGDPRYYQRFGFEPSGPFGIYYPPVGKDNPHFQVCRLGPFDPALGGEFIYCWE